MNSSAIALAEDVLPKIAIYVKNFAAISPYDLEDYRQDVYILAAEAVQIASEKQDVTPESIFWKKFIYHTKRSFRSEVLLSNPDDIDTFCDFESVEEQYFRFEQEQKFDEGLKLATDGMSDQCRDTWYKFIGIGESGKLSLDEIAESGGVSVSTVRSRLSRSRSCVVSDIQSFLSSGKIAPHTQKRRRRASSVVRNIDIDSCFEAATENSLIAFA